MDTSPASDGNKNVLVVEDDFVVLEALRKRLVRAGYRVTAASTAHEARSAAECNQFDAITVDVRLPDFDGLELASAIRRGGRSAKAPIVFVTGKVDRNLMDLSSQFDNCFFIRKPYDPALLIRLLTSLLSSDGTKPSGNGQQRPSSNGHRA